jgi:general secretion pathway protein G
MFQQIRAERGERGFTLVELLVVIAILGVLAGVVVFSVSDITDNSASAACKTNLSLTRTAIESFRAVHGAYPTASTDLVPAYLSAIPGDQTVTYASHSVTSSACS